MNWGTCKSSNNIHFDFPAIMNDSRIFSSFIPNIELDNFVKQQNNITSNSEYRKYLQNNAVDIIRSNFIACSMNSNVTLNYFINKNNDEKPYIFNNLLSRDQPYGYERSDLKDIYLSKQELNNRIHAPRFNLEN